ncbi:sugar lactone lactonase YvrE [Methylobacterium sp. BE186]|uniref:SMP-30/gluconolactonase/LRE family protein n=1 Tax=Methylobacterium sp. BE186 TaxID=2817715 RepID=UPI00285F9913|nr:SMP-30/gluconolactonase/LRE family protein [Methylobacterium sp. BE186]MDR7036300.1 sugar lactone lactonase YvrE [Methylobacterium sp. BE186]
MSPIVHPHTPRVAVACGCELGEEILWDARSGTLVWVDIENPAVWRHDPETDETHRLPLDEKLSFALLTPDPQRVIAGFKSGVACLDLESGARTDLVRPEPYPPGNRLNSGNVGPDGALWFGSMDDGETEPTGGFHRWDGERLLDFGGSAAVTNGPVVSPDGHRLYTIDTGNGVVRVHDLDGTRVGEPRPLITFEPGWGKPDGLTLDADGHLWICHYAGSRITRFAPDGQVERILPVPTALVTKCAFGGADLSTLYITTCRRGRDPALDPMAGHVFRVETEFRGFPANIYRGVGT